MWTPLEGGLVGEGQRTKTSPSVRHRCAGDGGCLWRQLEEAVEEKAVGGGGGGGGDVEKLRGSLLGHHPLPPVTFHVVPKFPRWVVLGGGGRGLGCLGWWSSFADLHLT